MTREVFEAGEGRLKVVGRAGVCIDSVDLQAATEFGYGGEPRITAICRCKFLIPLFYTYVVIFIYVPFYLKNVYIKFKK